jgi:hypothetical protein
MRTIPIHFAPPASEPELLDMPWWDWTMMPWTAATLAHMWTVQVYAHLVLGRGPGRVVHNVPRRVRPRSPQPHHHGKNSFRTRP